MIKLELTPEMVTVIGQALALAPYGVAAPVVTELQKQITAQQQAPPDEPAGN